jgi:hypothetical protein
LAEKEFEINKKTLPYNRISKLSLSKASLGGLKLRICVNNEEDIVVSRSEKAATRLVDLFMRLLRLRLDAKTMKFGGEKPQVSPE